MSDIYTAICCDRYFRVFPKEYPGWAIFRGTGSLSGNTSDEIPATPELLWSLQAGAGSKSSPVVSNGIIYFCNIKGTLFAVSPDGKIKWKQETGSSSKLLRSFMRTKYIWVPRME